MAYQSQDIIRRSATNGLTPAPQARDFQEEVAKLIDVTTCIGCKACQVACSEWNDIRDTVGNNIGVYDNPNDLSAKSWTVMRFSEVEQNDKLEWLIRKDGCMHCSDPGCLKACPAEGAIIQYANGIVDFQSEQCIGCGYCIAGCPFDIPRLNPEDNRVYKCTLCVDRVVNHVTAHCSRLVAQIVCCAAHRTALFSVLPGKPVALLTCRSTNQLALCAWLLVHNAYTLTGSTQFVAGATTRHQ